MAAAAAQALVNCRRFVIIGVERYNLVRYQAEVIFSKIGKITARMLLLSIPTQGPHRIHVTNTRSPLIPTKKKTCRECLLMVIPRQAKQNFWSKTTWLPAEKFSTRLSNLKVLRPLGIKTAAGLRGPGARTYLVLDRFRFFLFLDD